MRSYVMVTGAAFALLALAHLARLWMEGASPLGNPFFVGSTALSGAFCVWAIVLLTRRAN